MQHAPIDPSCLHTTKTFALALISGRGSNMVALIDAAQAGIIPHAEVAVVISDQASAAGKKAQARGIESVVIERRGRSREDMTARSWLRLRDRTSI